MVQYFGLLDLNTADMVIILAILLLLFGSKKLPELSRGLGESVKEFRNGMDGAKKGAEDLKKSVTGEAEGNNN